MPEYDYALAGAYFVTVCTQGRRCVFGQIVDGAMHPNDAGRMAARWWHELDRKFPSIRTDRHVVMPNHFHGIIVIVGAALRGRPDGGGAKSRRPHRGAPTLGEVVRWFKTMTTNEYIRRVKMDDWPPFPGRLWQRNYHEHIIRNDSDLYHARQYIEHNPLQWALDRENPEVSDA